MYSKERVDLALYRLSKAKADLNDAKKTLELAMLDTAANRSIGLTMRFFTQHVQCLRLMERIIKSIPA